MNKDTWEETDHPRDENGKFATSGAGSTEDRKVKIANLKEKRLKSIDNLKKISQQIGEDGTITDRATADRYQEAHRQVASDSYDLEKELGNMKEEKILSMKRATNLAPNEINTIRDDMLKSKPIYMALQEASTGVESGKDTVLDEIYQGKNKTVSRQQLHDAFEGTRRMLRKNFGNTITLYRAQKHSSPRTLVNMTTSKENAEQYKEMQGVGSEIKEYKIPIDDVIAVNISRGGGYEEFVIKNQEK